MNHKHQFTSFLGRNWPAFLICLFGLVTLFWFKGEILAGGDQGLPPPANILYRAFYTWDPLHPWLGFFDLFTTNSSEIFPYALFWSTLLNAGIPLAAADRIWVYLLYTLPGISMLYLASSIGIESKIARFLVSLFYIVNPYVVYALTAFGPVNTDSQLMYTFTPLILGLTVRGLRSPLNYRYAAYIALASLFAGTTFENAPKYIFIWAPSALFLLYSLVIPSNRKIRSYMAKFAAVTVALVAMINAYLLVYLYLTFESITSGLVQLSSVGVLFYYADHSSFSNVIRTLAGYAWSPVFYSFYFSYDSPLLIAVAFSIPALAIGSLLLNNGKKMKVFFAAFFVLCFFLAAGPNGIGEALFLWLYNNLPYFYIFRDPTTPFESGVVISFAILLGFLLDFFLKKWNFALNRKLLLITAVVALIFLSGFPILNGSVMPNSPRGISGYPGVQVNFPSYWANFSAFASSQWDGRILLVPTESPVGNSQFWYNPPFGYWGPDPAIQGISAPFASPLYGDGPNASLQMLYLLNNCNEIENASLANLLNLLNIEYVLFRPGEFYHESYLQTNDLGCWNSTLSSNPDFALADQWGSMLLYRNVAWHPSLFSSGENVVDVDGDAGILQAIFGNQSSTDSGQEVFVLSTGQAKTQVSDPDAETSVIISSYKEVDPTDFQVQVKANGSYVLVFSESFAADWLASINGMQIPGSEHFMVNGYANGWNINKTGSYTIDVSFWPQQIFVGSLVFSLLAAALTTIVLLLGRNGLEFIKIRCWEGIRRIRNLAL